MIPGLYPYLPKAARVEFGLRGGGNHFWFGLSSFRKPSRSCLVGWGGFGVILLLSWLQIPQLKPPVGLYAFAKKAYCGTLPQSRKMLYGTCSLSRLKPTRVCATRIDMPDDGSEW